MYEPKQRFNFDVNDGEINDEEIKIEYVGSQVFPKIPVKPFVAALLLLICGVTLLILGFVQEFTNFKEPSRGIAFWVLSSLTLIPGAYFTVQFYKAFKAKTPSERLNVLRNIPEIN